MEPDLSRLFAELNLSSNCTLAEFQRAVRRRISELHPDRTGPRGNSPEQQAELHRLLSAYSAVTRFHRRYGRMPGAQETHHGVGDVRATMIHQAFQIPIAPEPEPEPVDVPSARIALLFVALVVLLASWDWVVQAA